MKNISAVVFLLFLTLSSLALHSQEKWDANTCMYTNHEWHFHWNLEKDLEWEKVQSNEPHTVFKVISGYGLIAFVNINPFSTKEQFSFDLWDNFEDYKRILKLSWDAVEQRIGSKTTPLKVEKCRFAGENAVKVIVKSTLHDDVVDETFYGYTYTFHKDSATWSVSVKTSAEIWATVGENAIKSIFEGFAPNAKPI